MIVRHYRGSYEIEFCLTEGAFKEFPADSFVITDENVARLHGPAAPVSRPIFAVAPGEQSKSFQVVERLVDWLAESGASRNSTVVAWGGGVIGDLAGLVAAVYMRGIEFVQIPTTLLAMVDSSVGGKVGIDTGKGKNLVGAFWPPSQVRVAVGFLDTLDPRDWKSGMAEVIKYGLIMDEALFAQFEEMEWTSVEDWRPIVERCIELKRQVVEQDEFETLGLRATLNFGHTIGHAIEAATNYAGPSHGEAVAIGMVIETRLAERLGFCPSGTASRIAECLALQGLPYSPPPGLNPESLVEIMQRDKKATERRLAFSLLTRVGECKLVRGVPREEVLATLTNG
ncbi:MAG: 3-dehydroquinate synthase [Fimbriimonadaceae bacterium]|nr:3-dehydroquinate synthase [Fimbriimonadaceae bacterium]